MPIQIVFLPGIRGLKKGKDPVNYYGISKNRINLSVFQSNFPQ